MKRLWKRMSMLVLVSFGVALVAGVFTTWPLARHAHEGISALHRAETGSLRVSMPGDHLQLMYFFQLMRDFITGDTPWFHNLYEFNEGDDAARYAPDFYYVPFSVVFSFVDILTGNPALAWNLAGFSSLWLGALGILLLVRRFTSDGWIILAATVAGTVLPYRLITFLHGSPTGFGVSYVPFMLLGLDAAIRSKKIWGGVLAGAVFFFSEWVDLHVYFFLALVTPFWCAFVYLYDDVRFDWRRVRKIALALLPMVLFVGAAGVRVLLIRQGLKGSVMAEGRTVTEVAQFAASPEAYWTLNPDHPSSYVYLTYMIPLMILIGFVQMCLGGWRDLDRQKRIRFGLTFGLLAGVCGVLLLGLGPRMPLPRPDKLWELFVRVVRPYRMIRQPAKIQVLLPSLLAVLMVLPYARARAKGFLANRRWIYGILALLLLGEVAWRIDPAISLMDKEQAAYASVVSHAASRGEAPRALSVVLWPGDTHWTSLNQYYGIKYHIRMLNGYSPSVSAHYFDDVFLRFASLNRGYASDYQLDALLSMDIRYLLIHEDAFPEKVSPFGVAQTIKGFLAHPRIRFMVQDRSVWSFEIMEEAASEHIVAVDWDTASVTYCWDAERLIDEEGAILSESGAHAGRYVRLTKDFGQVQVPDWGIHYADRMRVSMRVRGQGALGGSVSMEEQQEFAPILVDSADWVWVDFAYPEFEGYRTNLHFTVYAAEGSVDIDYVYVAQGNVPDHLGVGEVFRMPAATLFRAGYTRLADGAVIFEPELVPEAFVLYGPRLPLPVGRYAFRLLYASDVDGVIGEVGFRHPGKDANPGSLPVLGEHGVAVIPYVQTANLPVTMEFLYRRIGKVTIHALEIERLD